MFSHLRGTGNDNFVNMAAGDNASEAGFSAAPSVAFTAPASDIAAHESNAASLLSQLKVVLNNAVAAEADAHDGGHAGSGSASSLAHSKAASVPALPQAQRKGRSS